MKNILLLILFVMAITSCDKNSDDVNVMYRISKAYSPIALSWIDDSRDINSDTVLFDNGEDIWNRTYTFEKGDIVYVSAVYSDSASSVTVEILLDGKIFKSGASNNEPGKYVIVSGTIPY